MITKETIMEAYLFMRKENQSVPSETLEFMKDTALAELEKCKVENLDIQRVINTEGKLFCGVKGGFCQYEGRDKVCMQNDECVNQVAK